MMIFGTPAISKTVLQAPACSDSVVNRVRQEYESERREIVPSCDSFRRELNLENRLSRSFAFGDLSHGTDRTVAIITDELIQGLEEMIIQYGKSFLVTNGYRNPLKNSSLGNAAPNSRHQYGEAADTRPPATALQGRRTGTIPETKWELLQLAARSAGFSTPVPYKRENDHVHVQLRTRIAQSRERS